MRPSNGLKQYEDKIAQTKERALQKFGPCETFTILNVRSEKLQMIYRDRNMGGNIIYSYWGLKPQEKVLTDLINGIDDESSFWLPMPAQRMPLANCWTAGCGNPSTPLKTIVSIESTSINFCLTIRSSR